MKKLKEILEKVILFFISWRSTAKIIMFNSQIGMYPFQRLFLQKKNDSAARLAETLNHNLFISVEPGKMSYL